MKNNYLCWILYFSAILTINNSCTEEDYPSAVTVNIPPMANAGIDQTIELPQNSLTLIGSGSTSGNINESTFLWKKIDGPQSFTILTPTALRTVVTDLTEGVYRFELTVTDSEGNSARDNCIVKVEQNKPPIAYAGYDNMAILPTDFCWINGSYYDYENEANISFLWEKVSGPSTYVLENPESLRTKVSKLGKGVYEFELTITDKSGLTGKDKVTVTVGEISAIPNEKTFNDLSWVCEWDCYIEIKNIFGYLPPESVFKVYIQKNESANWVEAFPLMTDLSLIHI